MVKPPLRTKSIGFKVSEEEYARLETAAQASGRTLGEWCREVILRGGSASEDPALTEIIGVQVKIAYRDFYDVPRMLIVSRRGLKLLLDSPFDDSLDEYSPTYKVYVLPNEVDEHTLKSWEALPQMATKSLGEIPVNQVVFDATKRAEVDAGVIDSLLESRQVHT